MNDHISLTELPSIFAARQWRALSVNESSSLKAYTTYEYFLRRTPSLLATLHTRKLTTADSMFAELEEFNFVAIFPFYNHIDEILKSVRKMKKLRVLRTKLCPEPDSTVLNDEIEAAGGHIDVNDRKFPVLGISCSSWVFRSFLRYSPMGLSRPNARVLDIDRFEFAE